MSVCETRKGTKGRSPLCVDGIQQQARNAMAPLLFVCICLALAGCTTSRLFVVPPPNWQAAEDAVVLLLPPDVQLSMLRAGGMEEVRADWTLAAYKNLKSAFAGQLALRGVNATVYDDFSQASPWHPEHAGLVKLHEAVGGAILTAPLLPTQRYYLPHLNYSLGDTAALLKRSYGARYAILSHSHAAYASGGRVALALLGAVGGVALPTGTQREFVSLIDLEDGRVIWFNVLPARGSLANSVDARTFDGASAMASALLEGLPL